MWYGPEQFQMKIQGISALAAKLYLDVCRSVPDMKLTLFCKVSPWRAQNLISRRFLSGSHRGFPTISRVIKYFIIFAHRFERFQAQIASTCVHFRGFRYGPEQFSDENPQNFGAWGEVLPERGQKRSGHENHVFLQSATLTCSKHDFSSNFVGYWSRIFDDFHGFSHISAFLRIVLNASRRQIASKNLNHDGRDKSRVRRTCAEE